MALNAPNQTKNYIRTTSELIKIGLNLSSEQNLNKKPERHLQYAFKNHAILWDFKRYNATWPQTN